MDDDCTQRLTQDEFKGPKNAELSDLDLADVICILHPSTPAAYMIVKYTAETNRQHILQNNGFNQLMLDDGVAPSEAETIRINTPTEQATDLAIRFSSRVINAANGFCFGRNSESCDINLDGTNGRNRRVSQMHFRIYYNNSGVLMLEDVSTNGTIVDSVPVGGKKKDGNGNTIVKNPPNTRMLSSSSIIEIPSDNTEDIIKFVLKIPHRAHRIDQFKENFRKYIINQPAAQDRAIAAYQGAAMPDGAARGVLAAPFGGPPNTKSFPGLHPNLSSEGFGMRWSGGDKYKCTGILGKGAFAVVYQLATRQDGNLFAAKELEKRRFMKGGKLDNRLDNEMQIMKDIKHPNVVEFIDYVETDEHLYIIMEYVRCGDMAGYMQSHGTLPEHLAKQMTRQVLGALSYLHDKNITHRDIKPDNILIHSQDPFIVKLTDFGLSKVVKNNETFLKTFCGTLLYCAPEVFPHYDAYMVGKRPKRRRGAKSQRRTYGTSVDIWSYAAVLWYVLCGQPPFEGVVDGNGKGMFNKIMETSLDVIPLQECHISATCIDLLVQMLDTDPLSRPDEIACLEHEWLADDSSSMNYEPQGGLDSIAEADELDASQLNINDTTEEMEDSQDSTQSNGLVNARDAKRHKGQRTMAHQQKIMSTSENSSGSIPIMNDIRPSMDDIGKNIPQIPSRYLANGAHRDLAKGAKLFGEVSESALQSSGLFGPVKSGRFQDEAYESSPKTQWATDNPPHDDDPEQQAGLKEKIDSTKESQPNTLSNVFMPLQKEPYKFQQTGVIGFTSPHISIPRGPKQQAGVMRKIGFTRQPRPSGASPNPFRQPQIPHNSSWRESMVRELNMESSESSSGNTGNDTRADSSAAQPKMLADQALTPKARQTAFERQIKSSVPASFFFDPFNPSTHTLEYARKVSGLAFGVGGNSLPGQTPSASVPATAETSSESVGAKEGVNGSRIEDVNATTTAFREISLAQPHAVAAMAAGDMMPTLRKSPRLHQQQGNQQQQKQESPGAFVPSTHLPSASIQGQLKPPKLPTYTMPLSIYGRLTTTQCSYASVSFQLTSRVTTWGRAPGNAIVYPDGGDTRIPKVALEIWFLAPGIEKVEAEPGQNGHWTKMNNLDTVIATRGRSGIIVNGVIMKEKDDQGRRCYGRIFTGDEICIVPYKPNKPGLMFVCEFFVGRAAKSRKSGERFTIETLTMT